MFCRMQNKELQTLYRVIFLTGTPLNLLSVGRLVTDFKKTSESQTGPPFDRKTSKCLAKWIWFQHQENLGGSQSKQIWGGASLETFSGGGQLKKTPCIMIILWGNNEETCMTHLLCFVDILSHFMRFRHQILNTAQCQLQHTWGWTHWLHQEQPTLHFIALQNIAKGTTDPRVE